jgi:hypothetical protein
MDESDGDSVQIIESEQELNNLWPTLEKVKIIFLEFTIYQLK